MPEEIFADEQISKTGYLKEREDRTPKEQPETQKRKKRK